MRTLLVVLLLSIAASASATVSLESVQWTSDSAKPTAAGIARRGQVYFLLDYSDEEGRKHYRGLRDMARDANIANRFDTLYLLVVTGGNINVALADEPTEYWCKGHSNQQGLVRAFVGDAAAAIVLVDGNGLVTHVSRLGDLRAERKAIDALAVTAKPLVRDASQFPMSCKTSLADLRVGDVTRAMKNLKRGSPDATEFIRLVTHRVNEMVEMDVAALNDPATIAAHKMMAITRMNGLMAEFPKLPAAASAGQALKKMKEDKQLAQEQAAYAALMAYFEAMKKVSAKKAKETQLQWIPNITAKYGGTYAAEVATLIRKASLLDAKE